MNQETNAPRSITEPQLQSDEKCEIADIQLDASTQKKLIRAFVEAELCPCAVETFNAHDNRTIELTINALYHAVVNEMVLRGLATAVAETKET